MDERKICKECKKERRITQFTLMGNYPDTWRKDVCRMCSYDGLRADQKHLILREAYRNYLTWRDMLSFEQEQKPLDIITYTIPKEPNSDETIPVTISFHDLERALHE